MGFDYGIWVGYGLGFGFGGFGRVWLVGCSFFGVRGVLMVGMPMDARYSGMAWNGVMVMRDDFQYTL